MITHLYIKNFALIAELDIDFHAGFSVVTGETGAGKSIILGALGLLLGSRADVKTIKEGENKCIVEAHFTVDDPAFHSFLTDNDIDSLGPECILRREINANGKSRSFVNDSPISLQLLKELSEQLVDIHSQHQNLLLKNNTFQLSVVDTIAGNQSLLAAYTESFKQYSAALSALESTRAALARSRQTLDFIRFQYDELTRLNLQLGEDEALDKQFNTMQHAEDIKRALYDADHNLGDEQGGILIQLHRSLSSLSNILNVYAPAEELHTRLNNAYIELKELSGDIAEQLGAIEYDPDEMERINNRLDAIYSAEKKHSVKSIAELLDLQQKFKAELDVSDNSEVTLADLEKALHEALERCEGLAQELSAQRRAAVSTIESEMKERLQGLGLENVQFAVSISAKDQLSIDGADRVEFLFSANVGVPLRAISEVASGGEIARVMLALKAMLSGAVKLPTIIFDEIDTGVSGKVAEQMALTMKEMSAANRQVISITHLPQIAACGATHYKVYKLQSEGATTTRMKILTDEERIEELAQMLSGNNVSQAAIHNAKTLLGQQDDILILT